MSSTRLTAAAPRPQFRRQVPGDRARLARLLPLHVDVAATGVP